MLAVGLILIACPLGAALYPGEMRLLVNQLAMMDIKSQKRI